MCMLYYGLPLRIIRNTGNVMYLIASQKGWKAAEIYAGPLLVLGCWGLPMAAKAAKQWAMLCFTSVHRGINITWISVHWLLNIALPAKGGNVSDSHLPQDSRPKALGVNPLRCLWQTCDTRMTWFNDLSRLLPGKVKLPAQGWSILMVQSMT
jgi:hypothetical protein